jgi:hypothetical protein
MACCGEPVLEAAVSAWGRELAARLRALIRRRADATEGGPAMKRSMLASLVLLPVLCGGCADLPVARC